MTATKYYVDGDGKYLGGFAGYPDPETGDGIYPPVPDGGIEVPSAPYDARAVWNGTAWDYSIIPAVPNVPAFIVAAKAALGGVPAFLTNAALWNAVSICFDAVSLGNWDDAASVISAAKTASLITSDQYAALQTSVTANGIPITLP